MENFLILGTLAFTLTIILTKLFVTMMKKAKLGQYIRDYGPDIHKHKSGTPTMGGLVILKVFSLFSIPVFFISGQLTEKYWWLVLGTLGFGLIGLTDDLISLFVKKASLGLKARYKFILQVVVASILTALLLKSGTPQEIKVPFTMEVLKLGLFSYAFLNIFILVSTVNATNLADGLDGLVCGISIIVISTYMLFIQDAPGIFGLALVLTFSLLGFLWFNFYPASVFLGDTGSFALGGFIGSLAILTGTQFILPIIAMILVVETLSVLLQVASFKLFGVRIFKISPLHHHFENAQGIDYFFLLPNSEWAEPTITTRFWISTAVFCLIGILAYQT